MALQPSTLNQEFNLFQLVFSYCGCGWKSADQVKSWTLAVSDLLQQMFGTDFLTFDKDHGTVVDEKVTSSLLEYCHDFLEKHYSQDSASPQDNTKQDLCHHRVNLVSADDSRQMLQKQQPPPKRKKCCDFTAKLNDRPDLSINAQGDSTTAAQPISAPKESIQRPVSKENYDFVSIKDPSPLQSAIIIEDDQDDSATSQETTLSSCHG